MGVAIKFNSGIPVVNGPSHLMVIEVTGPASYGAGGFAVAASDLGLSVVHQVGVLSCTGELLAQYIKSTGKVKLSYPTGGADTAPLTVTTAPVAALTSTAGTVTSGTVTLSGSGGDPNAAILANLATAVTSGAAGLTPGVGKELPAAANASTITVTLLVQGRV